jgi:hypothetical protein
MICLLPPLLAAAPALAQTALAQTALAQTALAQTALAQTALAQTAPAQTAPALPGKQPTSTVPTNTGAGDTRTLWSPQLPPPPIDDNASPAAFVKAAEAAIAAGRLGEAQEAIERAESRALDRSVRPSRAGEPSHQPLVQQLAQARRALGAGDAAGAMASLTAALANPDSDARDE